MTPYASSIHQLVSHCKADANLAATVYKLIEKAPKEEQTDLFVRFLYEFRYTPTDKSSSVYEEFKGDFRDDLMKAKKEIDRFVFEHKDKRMSEERFHEELLNFVCNSSENDQRKKMLLFAACPLNKKLPYIDKTKAMTMTQNGFEKEEAKVDPIYNSMIRHIANQGFNQITEDASMYLPILEKGKDEHEKAILLSLILMSFRSKMMPSLSRLLDDDEEE